jgi:lipid-binding SYLF domain-containing protein
MAAGIALTGALAVQARDETKSADLKEKDLKVLNQAPEVLRTLTSAPDKAIPQNLLSKAECVLVFPNVTKGAFIVGGEHGHGVATCRKEAGGDMGAPVMFTVGGASIGWQIGGQQSDLVLLVMDRNGMDNLLRDEFKIGGEGSVAAGPVGRTAEASTDALLGAQMLAWSRTQGLFAGVSLEGAVIKPNKDANQRLYGRPVEAKEIFDGRMTVPAASRDFVSLASRLTSGSDRSAQQPSSSSAAYRDTNADTSPYRDTRAEETPATTAYRDTSTGRERISGTVVSVSGDRVTIDTASGRRTVTLSDSTTRPADLRVGQRISIEHDSSLVATRITADGELPRTASPLPLIGLAGLLSLATAWRMRVRRT